MNSSAEKFSSERVNVNHVPQKTPVISISRNNAAKYISLRFIRHLIFFIQRSLLENSKKDAVFT
jgi:hypothetical protein